ncbi:flavin monoamine oxidase family protein [Nannocystis pusilla]|uniref:flavin monoamine oxidase family protein n=1 Tax=Nannocystis pusilla TaxID=889268 RepID=UPI003B806684
MLGRRQFGKLGGWLALGFACDFDRGGDPQVDDDRWQRALQIARDLLLIGPEGQDLKLEYLKILIDDGLPPTDAPKKVLVIGAGIAGLTAGLLLKQAGHDVTILEANANRIGGRIKTFRASDPLQPAPFADPAQYAEAGAMRLPDFHPLSLALVDKLGLPRRLFYNVDVVAPKPTLVPPVRYKSFTGEVWQNGEPIADFVPPDQALRTWIAVNGLLVRRSEYADDPALVNEGFGVMGVDVDRTTAEIFNAALDPVRDYFSDPLPDGTRENKPTEEWIEGWARAIYDFDGYSMSRYLTEYALLDEATVDAIGTVENATSRLAVVHAHLRRPQRHQPRRPLLGDRGRLLAPALRVRSAAAGPARARPPGRPDRHRRRPPRPAVRVETVDESGAPATEYTADLAIVTIPFSSLRHVEFDPPLSYGKRRAIIEMHYDSATKIVLEFSRRWWEFTEADWQDALEAIAPGLYEQYGEAPATHVFGGGSVTDNPNRNIYYPSHAIPGSPGGVVLASYTWADDAARWDSMTDDERYEFALRGLQDVHGERIAAFYTGRGRTQSWMNDRYAFGEAAVFLPNQLIELHLHTASVEGPLHFAGEHTSLKHAWVEGALESAVRAALEVHRR